jgi:hypothetical protein
MAARAFPFHETEFEFRSMRLRGTAADGAAGPFPTGKQQRHGRKRLRCGRQPLRLSRLGLALGKLGPGFRNLADLLVAKQVKSHGYIGCSCEQRV